MRIFLADPNRDLLSVYRSLMEKRGHQVRTAFDGTQVLTLLGSGAFDLAILNERLPRIAHERLLRGFREEGIPSVVLLNRPLNRKTLLRPELANAYLSFPFSPEELAAVMENVREKAGETLECMGLSVSGFRFSGTELRLTCGELDLLKKLSRRERVTGSAWGVYVHALNGKLEQLPGKPGVQIAYTAEKGYSLVKAGEKP